jgi:quinol monooxygenase YgiN
MSITDLVVMTKATAKPDREPAVTAALRDVAAAARAQAGCAEYRLFRSAADPATTITFERWSSKAERDAFLGGPAVKAFVAAITGGFAETPQPMTYAEIV